MMISYQNKDIQEALKGFDLYYGKIDGVMGDQTIKAIKSFQMMYGIRMSGKIDEDTLENLLPKNLPRRSETIYPLETIDQVEIKKFYGPPGGNFTTFIDLPYTMKIAWDLDKEIRSFRVHERVAEPMRNIFKDTLEYYGIGNIKRMGLDLFGGCHNVRLMRGTNRPSLHSYGIACDINPAENRLKWRSPKAKFSSSEYDQFWDIVESHGAVSSGRERGYDWMHFQFARV
ncbi:MAG: peptidoglycan-binding protein [Sulfurovum sp.]|nr:peptidoglycan-binding protein [Sulfurovum sp.]